MATPVTITDTVEEQLHACVEERSPDPDDALTPTWENFQAARRRYLAGVAGPAAAPEAAN